MTETLNGLLSQRPGREPEVGQTKCFTVEKRVSEKTGKPWLKVKNATPDKGGLNYRILGVQQTDFVDAHGNISFNIELELAPNGSNPQNTSSPRSATQAPQPHQNVLSDPVGACKGHLARAANGMLLCLDAANYIAEAWKAKDMGAMTDDQFQAITSTLFINLDKSGLINTLPVAPVAEETERPF